MLCGQYFRQVISHVVKFFVDVTNASVQALQVRAVNASRFARSKAATESTDRAVASGCPFSKHQDSFFNFMKLNVELRSHRVNSHEIAAALGQFMEFMS